jgi:hypothetical protein
MTPDKILLSGDATRRVRICQRSDGLFQFNEEYLREDEDQGQKYAIWIPRHPPSGVFESEQAAEVEARKIFSWLERSE